MISWDGLEEFWKQGRARTAVSRAVKKGLLARGSCARALSECRGRIEGHHDDYDRPLEVVWLCSHHHRRLHVEKRAARKTLNGNAPAPAANSQRRRPAPTTGG